MKKTNKKCDDCGNAFYTDNIYRWKDDKLGKLKAKALPGEYHFCINCGTERIAYALMKRIEKAEKARE